MTLVPVRRHRRNFSAARPEKEQGTDADSKGNLQEKRAKSKSTSSRHQSSQLGQNFSQVAFDTRKLDTKMHTKYFNKNNFIIKYFRVAQEVLCVAHFGTNWTRSPHHELILNKLVLFQLSNTVHNVTKYIVFM